MKNKRHVTRSNEATPKLSGLMVKNNKRQQLKLFSVGLIFFSAQLLSETISTASAAGIPPAYDVQFIGGERESINNTGQVVGWTKGVVGSPDRAWVFNDVTGIEYLPVPAGWHSKAYDINDNGIIVGYASETGFLDSPGGAAQWQPTINGYEMTLINTVDTDRGSSAVAINNQGDIIGTRTFLTELSPGRFTTVTRGFLLESDGTFTANLNDLGFEATPKDINDAGQIVGGSLRMTNGIVENLGAPTGYTATFINAINNFGQVAASSVLSSSSARSATRFTDSTGWEVLSFQGSEDAAHGINDAGDVALSASYSCSNGVASPVVFLETIGTFCVQDLITNKDWSLIAPSYGNKINLDRQMILTGQNRITGEFGTVMLTPIGDFPPPTAAENLAAVAIDGDWQQPYNRIELAWTDTSSNENGFRIERAPFNGTWEAIDTAGINATSYKDLTIELGVTYEYRVTAFGLGGDSLSSNIATVTAPSNPVDTVAPVVSFISPTNGEQVSGDRIIISVNSSDNISVTSVDIYVSINGSDVKICTVLDPTTNE
ncbi:MAG: DUF3466 family protein, partial [Gammaproteobacteria bacterium]|nr:DUF3466 family protein [Gammaproteobacteria bacterium]